MQGELVSDRYRVQRKLGEGGMAIVYLAVDEKLGRSVAIKMLREKFENHSEVRVRFQHEARAISSLDHPNILKVYDYSGPNSQRLWIVTEIIHSAQDDIRFSTPGTPQKAQPIAMHNGSYIIFSITVGCYK